jgi:Helix-turn-helix domain
MGKKISKTNIEPSKRPHFEWQEQVAARTDLSPVYKIVLWRLALHRNMETGRCDPARSTLAKGAGVSIDTVKRAITKAEQLGLLAIKRTSSGRHHDHNHYQFLREGVSIETPLRGATQDPLRGATQHPTRCSAEHRKQQMNDEDAFGVPRRENEAGASPSGAGGSLRSLRPIGEGKEGEQCRDLRTMWDRGHLADATARQQQADEAAWAAALVSGAAPEAIFAAAKKWKAAADAPRYLPKLSDWLAARGWEKPPPKKSKQANGSWSRRRRGGRQGSGLSPGERIIAEAVRRRAQ